MNIFGEMIHSLYDFKSYVGFLKNRTFKTLLYGFMLGVLYFLFSVILPFMILVLPAGGLHNLVGELVPEFRLEDGRLYVEEPYELRTYEMGVGIYVAVDTERPLVKETSDMDILPYDRVMILDEENLLIKNDGEIVRMTYAEMNLGNWSRNVIMGEMFPYIMFGVAMCIMLSMWFGLLGMFFSVLVTAAFGAAMGSFLGCRLSFDDLCKLAVHARTPAIFLRIIYVWVPFVIPYFFIINYGVSAVYMWYAMKSIKNSEQEPPKASWTGDI